MRTVGIHSARYPKAYISTAEARRCRRKFLKFFPKGFRDQKYYAWERGYKVAAHQQWAKDLDSTIFRSLLHAGKYQEIALTAVRIEARTNLLFSFEKMALRDAVKSPLGAKLFATALYEFLHDPGQIEGRFNRWIEALAQLPRRQTRVLTWPLITIFGFLAQPATHIFLKPRVTQRAAEEYGFDFLYQPRPDWGTYSSLLELAAYVRKDLEDLSPVDMIDVQSFLWVQGSEEYAE
jgi:hypothetical protein